MKTRSTFSITVHLLSVILCIALIVATVLPVSVTAVQSKESVEKILAEFQSKVFEAKQTKQHSFANNGTYDDLDMLQSQTIQKLRDNGYDAYGITNANYDSAQELFNTNFSDIGLKKECSYIVIVGNPDSGMSSINSRSRSTVGSTYSYTHKGVTYTMRTVTVTSSDDPNYHQMSEVDLLTSRTDSFIQILLNASLESFAEYLGISKVFGTIRLMMDIVGIEVDFSGDDCLARLNAGTAWTRTFTQVWNDNFNTWEYGSSVEQADQLCTVTGMAFVHEAGQYQELKGPKKRIIVKSANYDSFTWKNSQAITSMLSGMPVVYDKTGDIHYRLKENSKILVTHREGF